MTEEEDYAPLGMEDVIEASEQYVETEDHNNEIMVFDTVDHAELDTEVDLEPEVITISTEDQMLVENVPQTPEPAPKPSVEKKSYAAKLSLGRIKNIMKMDPDVNIVQHDAVFLVTKATEMFLETLANETYAYLPKNKKTINKKELDLAINRVDCLCFLEGAMDF